MPKDREIDKLCQRCKHDCKQWMHVAQCLKFERIEAKDTIESKVLADSRTRARQHGTALIQRTKGR